ncbi:MAG: hypothetical protein NVS9B15_20190 [Acidobacteriaceae bacterium]
MTVRREMVFRASGALLFVVGGGALTLWLMFAAPSYWYWYCAAMLVPIGLVWAIRPRFAAALSIGPVCVECLLLRYGKAAGTFEAWLGVGCLAAIALMVLTLRRTAIPRIAIAASIVIGGCAFVVERAFTNKHSVRRFEMTLVLNGKAPWGDLELGEHGEVPLGIYRKVRRKLLL